MAAPAAAAAGAPIDLDATVARLRALPTPQKISLSGALAVLICVDTCVSGPSYCTRPWHRAPCPRGATHGT